MRTDATERSAAQSRGLVTSAARRVPVIRLATMWVNLERPHAEEEKEPESQATRITIP
jgi:hypothetical protein